MVRFILECVDAFVVGVATIALGLLALFGVPMVAWFLLTHIG